MQQSNQPPRYLIPFAQNDSTRVEVPPTTADPTRASQSEGFPPLTGTPPEAGGVPPQRQDFNGAMNQVARLPWWWMLGGRYGFDATFAGDPAINGYPLGSVLPAADNLGDWMSTANDNLNNPDTNGAGWVPGYHYGATSLSALAGGTVTLTPAQAAKRVINLAGVLTSNLTIIVPNWVYDWTVYNNTSGAFSVSVKTALGAGVVIPQNASPTPVRCDGTVCSLVAMNIAPATSPTQAARFDQIASAPTGGPGRLLGVQVYNTPGSATYTPPAGTAFVIVEVQGGGGQPATLGDTVANQAACSGGGGGGGYARARLTTGFDGAAVVVGAGGSGGGATGGTSSFGTSTYRVQATGGSPGNAIIVASPNTGVAQGGDGGTASVGIGAQLLSQADGQRGSYGLVLSVTTIDASVFGGNGGGGGFGGGGRGSGAALATGGNALPGSGAGGGGAAKGPSSTASRFGGTGGSGYVIVYAYSA